MDREDKRKTDEYKRNPMINFSDSINRSMIGDINNLIKGNPMTRVFVTVIVFAMLFLLLK